MRTKQNELQIACIRIETEMFVVTFKTLYNERKSKVVGILKKQVGMFHLVFFSSNKECFPLACHALMVSHASVHL